MAFKDLVKQQNMTGYRLSKLSGVPQTTITDLMSGKADIRKCTAQTLYQVSKALNISMESIICNVNEKPNDTLDFDIFRSEECHLVKSLGDISYLSTLYQSRRIDQFWEEKQYRRAFYLLGMADYLSRIHSLSPSKEYEFLRTKSLKEAAYPNDVLLMARLKRSNQPLKEARKQAIPEFLKFNIIEGDIRNVQ
jgi:transcriptional regulator with XRE-family HTH domain